MKRVAMACFLLLLVSACAGATSRTARPLEVRSSEEGVLACVPQDEGESVEIDAAGVTAITVEGYAPPKPWTIVLDPGHPPSTRTGRLSGVWQPSSGLFSSHRSGNPRRGLAVFFRHKVSGMGQARDPQSRGGFLSAAIRPSLACGCRA